VLKRGYSVTLSASGQPVRSVADVRAGDQVRTRVSDGEFTSTVGGSTRQGLPPASVPSARLVARRVRKPRLGPEQPGLFEG
jgi:hypothetical protein